MKNYTLYGNPEYSTTLYSKRSLAQAHKLLDVTPSSFFFVYNTPISPWEQVNENELMEKTEQLKIFADTYINFNWWASKYCFDLSLKDYVGTRVLSATTVLGCFNNSESKARLNSSSVKGIQRTLRYSSKFYDFMVNDVLQGKIGDPREDVILAASGKRPEVFNPSYTLYFEIIDHY